MHSSLHIISGALVITNVITSPASFRLPDIGQSGDKSEKPDKLGTSKRGKHGKPKMCDKKI